MFLCAKYCALLGSSLVCIHSVDTDVLVLSFYYFEHANSHSLTFNLSVHVNILGKSEEHLLNVSNADYDVDMRRAFPGLHEVTGSVSVNVFFRRGIKGFRLLLTKVRVLLYKFAFGSKINLKNCLLEIFLRLSNKILTYCVVIVKRN